MENVNWIFAQLGAQRQRNANKRCMRQRDANSEIRPAIVEAFQSLAPGNIQRVIIDSIDLGERFNQICGVAFVSGESGPNRVGVNCYTQNPNDSPYTIFR